MPSSTTSTTDRSPVLQRIGGLALIIAALAGCGSASDAMDVARGVLERLGG